MTTTKTRSMSGERAKRLYAALTTPRHADPDLTLADAEGLIWCRTFEEFVEHNGICIQSPTLDEVNARRGFDVEDYR